MKQEFYIFFLIGYFAAQIALAQSQMNDPPNSIIPDSVERYGAGSSLFFDFYQNYFSPIKGGNQCPMHPSCSQYAKLLFDSIPFYSALTLTCERILRCGHELYR